MRWWLGELSVQRGNWKDAERYFASLWPFTHAHYRRAQALEQLGRHEEAREEYELFADTWKDADPELQPLVADARQAAKRPTSVIAE